MLALEELVPRAMVQRCSPQVSVGTVLLLDCPMEGIAENLACNDLRCVQ
jgi:hypothetical protein